MTISGALGLAADVTIAGSGAWAAWLWYRASKVPTVPIWAASGVEPVDPHQKDGAWIASLLIASAESARLNARAAGWTGASVAIAAAKTVAAILTAAFA